MRLKHLDSDSHTIVYKNIPDRMKNQSNTHPHLKHQFTSTN